MSAPLRVVLAAGGTGGHVFPAEALAVHLLQRGDSVYLFTDPRGRTYEARFPGVTIERIPSGSPSQGGLFARLRALAALAAGVLAAWYRLRRMKADVVVGFGGYPAFPTMFGAMLAGIPTVLHEQNAVLGRVNRLLLPWTDALATSFAETRGVADKDRSKLRLVGNPVRPGIAALYNGSYPSIDADAPIRLLVTGGSQGAQVFNDTVPAAIDQLPLALRQRLSVTQQCRKEDISRVEARYAQMGVRAQLTPFIEDMPLELALAHLCIMRAGASSVAELAVAGRPAILIPFPHALDDHQSANAAPFAASGAAWLLPQTDLDDDRLAALLRDLLIDCTQLEKAAARARKLARPTAISDLADLVTTCGGAKIKPTPGTSLGVAA